MNCLRSHRFSLILGVSLLLAGVVSAQTLFNKPVKVFGDPNFIGTAANPLAYDTFGPNVVEGRELSQPFGIALDNSVSSADHLHRGYGQQPRPRLPVQYRN